MTSAAIENATAIKTVFLNSVLGTDASAALDARGTTPANVAAGNAAELFRNACVAGVEALELDCNMRLEYALAMTAQAKAAAKKIQSFACLKNSILKVRGALVSFKHGKNENK